MKKLIIIAGLLCAFINHSYAQGVLGFFSQQKNKDKDMMAQIVLLQTYLGYVRKGYSITHTGLQSMRDLKDGSFRLNAGYFSSLGTPNPAITHGPKVQAIIRLRQQILVQFTEAIRQGRQQGMLTAGELAYAQAVYQNLRKGCDEDISELDDVINAGKLQLTDAQRLQRIDSLYTDMKDKYAFCGYFTAHMSALSRQRLGQRRQDSILKQLYNIH